jgi:hypothetical protein
MESITMRSLLTTTALLAIAPVSGVPVWANDRDLRATQLGAATCDLTGSQNFDIRTGAVVLTQPGQTRFTCALPLNNIDLGGTTNDNDITSLAIFYKDGDASAIGTNVSVTLWEAGLSASFVPETKIVCSFNSTLAGTGTAGWTKSPVACAWDLSSTKFYFFEVVLRTNLTGATPAEAPVGFMGIRFP